MTKFFERSLAYDTTQENLFPLMLVLG